MVPFYFSASNNFLPNSPRIIVPSVTLFSQVNSVQAFPLQVRTTLHIFNLDTTREIGKLHTHEEIDATG